MCIYPVGTTDACMHAAALLQNRGCCLVDHPTPEITHLLLDVPSFQDGDLLRSGEPIAPILRMLPQSMRIIGGNLDIPQLEGYQKTDLLKDEVYLAENAAITADCAIRLAGARMSFTFRGTPALVIGWGRIGKCLCKMLTALGSPVTVAARKPSDRAMAQALGCRGIPLEELPMVLPDFPLLFNTVPYPILFQPVPQSCIALELASGNGIPDKGVVTARGLPGKMAPETSGKLIADTIVRIIKEEKP